MPNQHPIPTQLNIAPRGKSWKNWQLVDGPEGFPTREAMEKHHCNPERVRELEECRERNLETIDRLNACIAGLEAQLAAAQQGVQPFGYVNTQTGQFFKDVEPCRQNNEGHWRTVYTHPTTQGLDVHRTIKAAADKLDAAKRCDPTAVDALVDEALEILDAALAANAQRLERCNSSSGGQASKGMLKIIGLLWIGIGGGILLHKKQELYKIEFCIF